ncbi:MAG: DNA gyrase inhibitor YacG [Planctomycetes bacterium]|nr:DNA gyrase inhibitor YacG [Planctomycetota bacterium]
MNDGATSRKATCPQCGRQFTYDSANEPSWHPFCRRRCQWIDLGQWFSGEHRISKDLLADDEHED